MCLMCLLSSTPVQTNRSAIFSLQYLRVVGMATDVIYLMCPSSLTSREITWLCWPVHQVATSIFPRGSKMIAPQRQLVLFINILIYWFGNIIINQVDFDADQKTDFLVQMEPFFLFGPLFLICLLCWWNYIEAGEQTTSKEITFQECNDCSLKSMIGRCTFYI